MTDATQPDQTPNTLASVMSAEKLAEVKAKLAHFVENKKKTVSGSEAPSDQQAPTETADGKPLGQTLEGKDVDWSEYDLDFNVRHLYPVASFCQTPKGPKWVAVLDEFYTTLRRADSHGKMVNAPGQEGVRDDLKVKEPLNLGDFLSQKVNGAGGWQIAALLPTNGDSVIALFKRENPVILPDPLPLKKEMEVAAPTDPELEQVEGSAIEFMASEGLLLPSSAEEEEPFRLTPVPADEVQVEESGAITMRDSELIHRALRVNLGETVPPPVPAGGQPDPWVDEAGTALAAGAILADEAVRRALEGPDFGEV
jgi:hypothetical protein